MHSQKIGQNNQFVFTSVSSNHITKETCLDILSYQNSALLVRRDTTEQLKVCECFVQEPNSGSLEMLGLKLTPFRSVDQSLPH